MNRLWKTLIVSVALFQLVLTIAFWRMLDYVQWLHFNDLPFKYQGFMDTSPGRSVGYMLLGTAALLILINLVVGLRTENVPTTAGPSKTTENNPTPPFA